MSGVVIAIISNPDKLSGKLAKWATGTADYHVAFVDLEGGRMYDMNLLFRRRLWPHYKPEHVTLFECPVPLLRHDLEAELDESADWYGVFDYVWFAFKKLFGGDQAPSFKGAICSEKVAAVLVARGGWISPFVTTPSPADFRRVLNPFNPKERWHEPKTNAI